MELSNVVTQSLSTESEYAKKFSTSCSWASRLGAVLPIYILEDLSPLPFKRGGASQIYLYHSFFK
jgi:hypothetical protein